MIRRTYEEEKKSIKLGVDEIQNHRLLHKGSFHPLTLRSFFRINHSHTDNNIKMKMGNYAHPQIRFFHFSA